MLRFVFILLLSLPILQLNSQDCFGGQIYTNDAYLYGRFEVKMKSVGEDGVVSSFFLYNLDLNCNWPAENNEIDIEMTGDDYNVQFTTHIPGPNFPLSYTSIYTPWIIPHSQLVKYAFEWEPTIVRWFIEDSLVYSQSQSHVFQLIYPMRIMMNLWAADNPAWVGNWDPTVMPQESEYDFVKYYSYTPGSGNYGTNNNYTFQWEDQFDSLNIDRWKVEEYGGFSGNFCTFTNQGVEFRNGYLYLQMKEDTFTETIPVTFNLNAGDLNMNPGDKIHIPGSFNNWCGNCNPMSFNNGIWSTTIDLPLGDHEYVFTKNFWDTTGFAPLGSECDFKPCDQWANFGFTLSSGDDPLVLDTLCWSSCSSCESDLFPNHFTTEITANSARLYWIADNNCNYSYEIRGKELGSSNWVYLSISNGTQSFKNVSDLSANTTYIWQIRANCNSNNISSNWSKLDTFYTECKAPDAHWIEFINNNTINLKWNPVPGAFGYEIQGKEASSSKFTSLISPGPSTDYLVFNLPPSPYLWKVKTFCSSNGKEFSDFTNLSFFTVNQNSQKKAETKLICYPNPVTNYLQLDLKGIEGDYEVAILTVDGKIVNISQDERSSLKIETSKLRSGSYFIELKTKEKVHHQKFIKL